MEKKISYEIKTIDQPQTLVLEKPAQVKFINVSQIPFNTCTINNDFILGTWRDYVAGTALYPYELDLTNNANEIDKTNYTINGTPNEFILKVIIKYFE